MKLTINEFKRWKCNKCSEREINNWIDNINRGWNNFNKIIRVKLSKLKSEK